MNVLFLLLAVKSEPIRRNRNDGIITDSSLEKHLQTA